MPDKRKRRSYAERTIQPHFEQLDSEHPEHPSPLKRQKKSKTCQTASGKVECTCGCRQAVTRRTQRLHLNGGGPIWIRHGRSTSVSSSGDADLQVTNPWATQEDDSDAESVSDGGRDWMDVGQGGGSDGGDNWMEHGGTGTADVNLAVYRLTDEAFDAHTDSESLKNCIPDRFLGEPQSDLEDVDWEHTYDYTNPDSILQPNGEPNTLDTLPLPTADFGVSGPDHHSATPFVDDPPFEGPVDPHGEGSDENNSVNDEEKVLIDSIWHVPAAGGNDRFRVLLDEDTSDEDNEDPDVDEAPDAVAEPISAGGRNTDLLEANPGIYDVPEAWDPEAYKETGILTARDTLDLEFVRQHARRASNLGPCELNLVRAFNYKVDTLQKDSAYQKMPLAFPALQPWTSLPKLRSFINRFAGVYPQPYDCCIRSCLMYAGPYKDLEACTYCHSPRFDTDNRPTNQYYYIPLTERLSSQYGNAQRSQELRYRSTYIPKPGVIADIFDSSLYIELRNKQVEINGKQYTHRFFSDSRDVAIGLSFDGFCPFKRRKATCWPIIAFNYNLPPKVRFHQDNILPLGTIPGPKQMKDTNSFLIPLVNELLELAKGVKVYDALTEEYFIMRVYLITAFGDIPAAAKLMNMKGHNAILPCRFCNINGIRCPGASSTIHYVPLYRSSGPCYDPSNLPLRTSEQFARQAEAVATAETNAELDKLSKATGIKGITALSRLPSLTLPDSFPADVMHLFYENLLPELLDLWTESYKGFDEGSGDYSLSPTVFKAICEAVVDSGNTIPASYGCRVPNPQTERFHFTAEAWSIWGLIVGPVVLHNRFHSGQVYTHFLILVRLMNITLKLEVTEEELDELEAGLAKWVVDFETIYIQKDMKRIPIATLPVHYLLHLAQSIRRAGPVWCSWAFPMERYCGTLLPAVTSRKHPFASINRREKELEQLRNLKMMFNLHDELELGKAKQVMQSGISVEFYPDFVLLQPSTTVVLTSHFGRLLLQHLSRLLSCPLDEVRQLINYTGEVETWGKLRFTQSAGGDTVHAREVVTNVGHDMSYIKFKALVAARSHRRNEAPTLRKRIFYGQLEHLLKVTVNQPGSEPQTYILALIQYCDTEVASIVPDHSVTMLKNTAREFRGHTVVDAGEILGVAARIRDRGQTYFAERPSSLDFFKNTLHVEDADID